MVYRLVGSAVCLYIGGQTGAVRFVSRKTILIVPGAELVKFYGPHNKRHFF